MMAERRNGHGKQAGFNQQDGSIGHSGGGRRGRGGTAHQRSSDGDSRISHASVGRRRSEGGQGQFGTRGRPSVRAARTSERGLDAMERRPRVAERSHSPGFSKADQTESEVSHALIVGRHPVLEALKSGRSMNKILLAESAEGGSLSEILAKAKASGVVLQRVPKAHLDSIANTTHHQGIVAYAAAHDYVELDEIISRETGNPPLVVLLDEVSDPYNLGAILRTAEATGAQGVVIPKRRAVPLTETVGKAAAGAMEYVPVARVANLIQAMETLKSRGYWIVGTDVEAPQSYTEVSYQGAIAIVIGAEGKGLSRLVREGCDYLVSLPMLGQLQSLNASVATGVLLYEVIRQRK